MPPISPRTSSIRNVAHPSSWSVCARATPRRSTSTTWRGSSASRPTSPPCRTSTPTRSPTTSAPRWPSSGMRCACTPCRTPGRRSRPTARSSLPTRRNPGRRRGGSGQSSQDSLGRTVSAPPPSMRGPRLPQPPGLRDSPPRHLQRPARSLGRRPHPPPHHLERHRPHLRHPPERLPPQSRSAVR